MSEAAIAENPAEQAAIRAKLAPAEAADAATEASPTPEPAEGAAAADTAEVTQKEAQVMEAEAASTSSGGASEEVPATEATLDILAERTATAGKGATEGEPAEGRSARSEAETRAAVASVVAQDPLEQPEPDDVHEVALEPEMPEDKCVLVIQTDGQVRGTLAGGCRTLPWITVRTASSLDLGEELIKEEPIDAIILALDEGAQAMDLLTRIRLGQCRVDAGIPVMAMVQEAHAELVGQLKSLGVTRLLLHPFTLGDVLETVEGMWTADGAPVVMPVNPQALKKAVEAQEDAKDAAADRSDEAKAAGPERGVPAEPEAGCEGPGEETTAGAEAPASQKASSEALGSEAVPEPA